MVAATCLDAGSLGFESLAAAGNPAAECIVVECSVSWLAAALSSGLVDGSSAAVAAKKTLGGPFVGWDMGYSGNYGC